MHPLHSVFHERLTYIDGVLYIKKYMGGRKKVGEPAGCRIQTWDQQRVRIQVNDKAYYASEIIWVMFNGDFPPPGFTIDHIDLNPLNDRIENLRLATDSQQQANRLIQKNNTSGFKGVTHYPNHNRPSKFRARLAKKHIGWYTTAEEAASAYDKKAKEVYGEFAKTNEELK